MSSEKNVLKELRARKMRPAHPKETTSEFSSS